MLLSIKLLLLLTNNKLPQNRENMICVFRTKFVSYSALRVILKVVYIVVLSDPKSFIKSYFYAVCLNPIQGDTRG